MEYTKGDFFIVPNRSVLKGMNYRDRSAFMELCAMADENGVCWPSFQTLADNSGMSRTSAIEAVNVLEERGLIVRTKRERKDGSQTSNEYKIMLCSTPDVPPSAPGDLGVVRQATTNYNQLELKPLSFSKNKFLLESDGENEDDLTVVGTDDWGEELRPRQKKDLTYRKVYQLWNKQYQGSYPTYWNVNPHIKAAAERMIESQGMEQIQKAFDFYWKNRHDKFCPKLSTPKDLEEKWDRLLSYKHDRR